MAYLEPCVPAAKHAEAAGVVAAAAPPATSAPAAAPVVAAEAPQHGPPPTAAPLPAPAAVIATELLRSLRFTLSTPLPDLSCLGLLKTPVLAPCITLHRVCLLPNAPYRGISTLTATI